MAVCRKIKPLKLMGYVLRLHRQWEWAGGYIPLVVKIEKIHANYKEEKDEER